MKKRLDFFDLLSLPFREVSLFLPFFLVLLAKWVWALILFYSVQWPFKVVLARLLVRFFGPFVLHYPHHIYWMFSVLNSTSWFFDVVLGTFASYFLVVMVYRRLSGEKVRIEKSLIVAYALASWLVFFLGHRALPPVVLKVVQNKWIVWSVLILANAFFQTIFTVPMLYMVLRGKLIGFVEGFRLLPRLFLPVMVVFSLGFLSLLPWDLGKGGLFSLSWVKMYPELSLAYSFFQDLFLLLINTVLHCLFAGWVYESAEHR